MDNWSFVPHARTKQMAFVKSVTSMALIGLAVTALFVAVGSIWRRRYVGRQVELNFAVEQPANQSEFHDK